MSKTYFKLICITLSSQNMEYEIKLNTVTALHAAVHNRLHLLVVHICSLVYVSNVKIQQNSQT